MTIIKKIWQAIKTHAVNIFDDLAGMSKSEKVACVAVVIVACLIMAMGIVVA